MGPVFLRLKIQLIQNRAEIRNQDFGQLTWLSGFGLQFRLQAGMIVD